VVDRVNVIGPGWKLLGIDGDFRLEGLFERVQNAHMAESSQLLSMMSSMAWAGIIYSHVVQN
jgi:hypothetical protein